MSDPFEYLEEAEDVARVGIGWLPLSLAGLAMAGFLAVPTLGFLKRKDKADDWSSYVVEDSVSVPSDSPDSLESLLTPNPEDLQQDLESVDETLGNLGVAYVAPADVSTVEVPPLQALPLQEKAVAKSPVPAPSAPSRPEGPHFEWTVKKGETLYAIGRKAGTTPRMIAKMNGINIDTPIVPGQILKIPGHRPVVLKPLVVASKSSYPDAPSPFREPVAQVRVPTADPVARKRVPKKTQNSKVASPEKKATEPVALDPRAKVRPPTNPPREIMARPRPVNHFPR